MIDVDSSDIYAEHFGVPGNKFIFIAMMYLYSKQIKPTPMAIMEVLNGDEAKKSVETLGGLEYLTLLEEARVPSENLPIFVEKIKQSYTRKMISLISDEMKQLVLSDKAEVLNPSELIGEMEKKLSDLSINTSGDEEVYKMGDETEEVLASRAETPAQVPGLEVGMPQYDKLTNGAQEGDLIIVCAESKVGKSVTLTNWSDKLSISDQIPGLYIDTEMTSRENEDRHLAMRTGIPHSEIVSGMYVMDTINGTADDKIAKLKVAREELKQGNLYHIYLPQFTIEKITALVRKFQIQFGIKYLVFDYIKIPSSQGNFRNIQEYQALGFLTSGLKDIAGLLKIPVFSACQANRSDLGGGKKDAGSIGGSYRILQLASKLLFLTNKSDEQIAKDGHQNGNQQLYIAFQRNGQSDCDPINIFFDRPIIKQVEV